MKFSLLKQKATATLALVAVCLTLLPVNAMAAVEDEEFTTEAGYRYVITSGDTVSFAKPADVSTSNYSGEVTVPANVEHDSTTYSVTAIQADAFSSNTALTAVTLPDSVTSIPDAAFSGCTGLTSVALGNAVTSIGAGAFGNCSALTSLTIPDTVTTIGLSAFAGLGATSLHIPASVQEVDAGLYLYGHLDGVTFAEGSPFKLDNGVLYKGTELVLALDRTITSYTVLPGTTSIGAYAFAGGSIGGTQINDACSGLTSVTLPSSLQTIENNAFGTITARMPACTALASVTFDGTPSLKEIGDAAFGGCEKLATMALPDSLTSIGESAFQKTAITSAVIPTGVTAIPKGAFSQAPLTTIVIPGSVTSVGMNAFSGLKSDQSKTTMVMMPRTTAVPTFDPKAFGVVNSAGVTPSNMPLLIPTEEKAAYSVDNYILKSCVSDNGLYGITPPALTSVKPMADAETTDANKLTFTADVPTGAELTVSSSNNGIATVAAENGTITVTGVASGDAEITATITLTGTDFVLTEKVIKVTVLEQDKEPAIVVPAEPETEDLVANDDTKSAEEKTTATNVANALKPTEASGDTPASDGLTVSQDKLTAAANQVAANNEVSVDTGKAALKDEGILTDDTVDDADVTIVIQPYLDITVKDVTITDTDESKTTTLTLDITPKYQTVATTADLSKANPDEIVVKKDDATEGANAVVLEGEGGILNLNGETVEVKIPLPKDFTTAQKLFVTHLKGNRSYVYEGAVESDVLTFTNPHGFSTFTIASTDPTVAVVNGTNYTSLQDALDEAPNNGTIELKQGDLSGTMYTDGKTVTVKNGTENEIKVTLNGKEHTLAAGATQQLSYTSPSGGGSSSSGTYAVTVENSKHGTVTVSPKRADKGDTVSITVKPDKGYELDELVVLDKNGDEVKLTKTANNKYTFKMPASKVAVEATFAEIVTEPVELPFTDVPDGIWYEDGVRFAYENGMMAGTSATTFAPELTTTRGMIVTILYRLENSPDIENEIWGYPFADVDANAYYGTAVYWARMNGIVGGYGNGNFGPNDPITREQMATILYRYAQVKGYDTTARADLSGYTDAVSINAYAVDAIAWANAEGLVNGTSATTLTPGGSATRAQVAVILMRFCENVVE